MQIWRIKDGKTAIEYNRFGPYKESGSFTDPISANFSLKY